MGHETVVHVALATGRLAGYIAMEAGRLAGLRTSSSQQGTAGLSTGRETAAFNDVTGTNG